MKILLQKFDFDRNKNLLLPAGYEQTCPLFHTDRAERPASTKLMYLFILLTMNVISNEGKPRQYNILLKDIVRTVHFKK